MSATATVLVVIAMAVAGAYVIAALAFDYLGV